MPLENLNNYRNNAVDLINRLESVADRNYSSRAALVEAYSDGDAPDGTILSDGTVQYVASKGATVTGLPVGLLPYGNPTPYHFGAVGDGTTDDQNECQSWANYIIYQGFSNIHVSEGIFSVNQITLSGASDIVISGGEWRLRYSEVSFERHIFDLSACERVTLKDMTLIGTSATDPTYSATTRYGGVKIYNNSVFCRVSNCTFRNFSSYGVFALNLGFSGGAVAINEGVMIDHCVFEDFPLDDSTVFQAGVIFGNEAEYSAVRNCRFYRIPSAARFTHGANSTFCDNVVMRLNGDGNIGRAALYSEDGSNNGKFIISGNMFNHIGDDGSVADELQIIRLRGDVASDLNTVIIEGNHLIANHGTTYSTQIILSDYPYARILNNIFRPNSSVANQDVISLIDCKDAFVEGNVFERGANAIGATRENVFVGNNTYLLSGMVVFRGLSGARVKNTKSRSFAFRISSAGVAGSPFDDANVTASRVGVGHFRLTHSFGNTEYAAAVTVDNTATASERRVAVQRSTTALDIYLADGSGGAVDADLLVIITHGTQSEYGLKA